MGVSAPALDLTGLSILIVEDDPDSREMLQLLVASFGAAVHGARDGDEGMDVVARIVPDLIFCDLQMPRMDGFQFLDWLRRHPALSRIPVIALTALGMPADIERTWAAGFSGHVVKPVDLDVIETQLRRVFPSRAL